MTKKEIFKKFFKITGLFFLGLIGIIILLLIYFNIPVKEENEKAALGVTFSYRYAEDIHLDWQAAYLAMLDELKVRKIRIPVYWDLVDKGNGSYDFSALDWQLEEARKRKAEIILVVGQKVPRWPECAIPERLWDNDKKRQEELLKFIGIIINRYKNNSEIKFWQVENEPFLPFGICPNFEVDFFDQELALVRYLDPTRPIIVTDSGELSLWVRAAGRADVFGTTMYRTIWKEGLGYFDYPVGPRFFQFKYFLNKLFADQDQAIVIELQAEPWISGYTTNQPLLEQFRSMNPEKMRENVSYARQVGFPEIYLWGVEWWYWLKVEKNHPELWEEAKLIFSHS